MKVTLIGIAAWVLSQSFTLSLPIDLRVMDASTHVPVEGAIALALWKSYTITLAGANPGPPLMAKAARSDAAGWLHIPAGFTFHRPFAPFSWYARDWDHLPQFLIADRAHEFHLENSPGFWPDAGILFGSPPVAISMQSGRSIDLQPLKGAHVPADAVPLKFKIDELFFTSRALTQHDRCIYVSPVREWLRVIEAAFPDEYWRGGEFDQLLINCL